MSGPKPARFHDLRATFVSTALPGAEPEDDLRDTCPSEEPEACSCDEALALRNRLDRCRAIVRVWRLAEVTPEAARVALERELEPR